MFKTWVVKWFKGGYLSSSCLLPKRHALKFLKTHDVYCIEKVKGLFKGQIIYKNPVTTAYIKKQKPITLAALKKAKKILDSFKF